MKRYEEPIVDIVRLEAGDIICSSGVDNCTDASASTTKEVDISGG